MPTFAEQLKKLRLRKGFSQLDLALRLSTSQDQVSKWETGARIPQMASIMMLCLVLDCTSDELIGLKP